MKLINNYIKTIIVTILFSFSLTQDFFQIDIETTGVSQLIIFQSSISGLEQGDEIGVFDSQAILNSQDCSSQLGELLVGADGSHSLVRKLAGIKTKEHNFEQTAIVANVTTQKPNQFTAYERFTPYGPIAFLPISNFQTSIVYSINVYKKILKKLVQEEYKKTIQENVLYFF